MTFDLSPVFAGPLFVTCEGEGPKGGHIYGPDHGHIMYLSQVGARRVSEGSSLCPSGAPF